MRSYRRQGLDPMAKSMVGFLETQGISGATILEVGGGIGAIQIELFKRGAASSLNVELSPEYEQVAWALAEEESVSDRITRDTGDFVQVHTRYERADVVIMNRVVCCYPWMERLVGAAASKTGRYLALSFPRDRWWTKAVVGLENALMGRREGYVRAFVHPPSDMEATASSADLIRRFEHHDLIWQAMVLERAEQTRA